MKAVIKSEGLSKYYGKGGEIRAVDGLDLEVYEGETFGALSWQGPSAIVFSTQRGPREAFFRHRLGAPSHDRIEIWGADLGHEPGAPWRAGHADWAPGGRALLWRSVDPGAPPRIVLDLLSGTRIALPLDTASA